MPDDSFYFIRDILQSLSKGIRVFIPNRMPRGITELILYNLMLPDNLFQTMLDLFSESLFQTILSQNSF